MAFLWLHAISSESVWLDQHAFSLFYVFYVYLLQRLHASFELQMALSLPLFGMMDVLASCWFATMRSHCYSDRPVMLELMMLVGRVLILEPSPELWPWGLLRNFANLWGLQPHPN